MSGWLAIVNRYSGGSEARARLPNILRDLSDLVEKTVFTEHPGHATELAMDATRYSGLAVVGGDGTLFEVLKGLDRKRQRVASFLQAEAILWREIWVFLESVQASTPSM